jgi:RNA ligase
MKYPHFDKLPQLLADRFITARPHPRLPLFIHNYTIKAVFAPPSDWTEPMRDCRGLILDADGNVVGRPFRKFWNYGQVLDQVPAGEPFTVWEKLDGSLGIITSYAGERIVATRGSFDSDQAKWLAAWLDREHRDFAPSGETWLTEIVYPSNRIVVDYGAREEAILLAVMGPDGTEMPELFDSATRFTKARRFDGMADFSIVNDDPRFAGAEGFVVKWSSGLMAKIKAEEYTRLHRLLTQCSTRTIWELLRTGKGVGEIVDRVPDEFAKWVNETAGGLIADRAAVEAAARSAMVAAEMLAFPARKEFAAWAKSQPNSSLLFNLLDGKDIDDACWKLVEPKWFAPFRNDDGE